MVQTSLEAVALVMSWQARHMPRRQVQVLPLLLDREGQEPQLAVAPEQMAVNQYLVPLRQKAAEEEEVGQVTETAAAPEAAAEATAAREHPRRALATAEQMAAARMRLRAAGEEMARLVPAAAAVARGSQAQSPEPLPITVVAAGAAVTAAAAAVPADRADPVAAGPAVQAASERMGHPTRVVVVVVVAIVAAFRTEEEMAAPAWL